MSGIDKICEYSGEYGYGEMYLYKKDLIQVLPKYHKEFKDKDGYLIMFYPQLIDYAEDEPHAFIYLFHKFFIPRFWTRFYWQWRNYNMYYSSPSKVWYYILYVPKLKGKVYGKYYNYTRNPEKAVNKISKLVNLIDIFKFDFPISDAIIGSNQENIIENIFERIDKSLDISV